MPDTDANDPLLVCGLPKRVFGIIQDVGDHLGEFIFISVCHGVRNQIDIKKYIVRPEAFFHQITANVTALWMENHVFCFDGFRKSLKSLIVCDML